MGGKGINGRFWEPVGGSWSTIKGSAGRGMVTRKPLFSEG